MKEDIICTSHNTLCWNWKFEIGSYVSRQIWFVLAQWSARKPKKNDKKKKKSLAYAHFWKVSHGKNVPEGVFIRTLVSFYHKYLLILQLLFFKWWRRSIKFSLLRKTFRQFFSTDMTAIQQPVQRSHLWAHRVCLTWRKIKQQSADSKTRCFKVSRSAQHVLSLIVSSPVHFCFGHRNKTM